MDFWQPKGPREAVFDGDLLVYNASSKYEKERTKDKALDYIENSLLFFRELLSLDDFSIYVTAGGNFRKELNPEYKANRKQSLKPRYLVDCYTFLFDEWKAEAERGYEADDLIAMDITRNPEKLLVSYDKDFKQIPGWHFDWRSFLQFYVNKEEAGKYLALQMLTGDRADNVKGLKGIGPVKAQRILDSIPAEQTLAKAWEVYKDFDKTWEEFVINYKCLKIITDRDKPWQEIESINND